MERRRIASVVVLLAAAVCGASPAAANGVVHVPCSIDAYALSDDNFTADVQPPVFDDMLGVGLSGNNEARAALEFDISALPPAGLAITSASLVLYATESDALIAVHGMTGNGAIEPGDFTFTDEIVQFDPISVPSPALNLVDVTAFIQTAAAGPDPFVVFQLRELFDNEVNSFLSTRSQPEAFHPYLSVSTAPIPEPVIPEPASLSLLGLGALGILVSRKRGRS